MSSFTLDDLTYDFVTLNSINSQTSNKICTSSLRGYTLGYAQYPSPSYPVRIKEHVVLMKQLLSPRYHMV